MKPYNSNACLKKTPDGFTLELCKIHIIYFGEKINDLFFFY